MHPALPASLALASALAAAPPDPAAPTLAERLRELRWRAEQISVACDAPPCDRSRLIPLREAHPEAAPGRGRPLTLRTPVDTRAERRRQRLGLRLLREMVRRVEVRRQPDTGWLLAEDAPHLQPKGMDGRHRPLDLVRMLERLLRAPVSPEPPGEPEEALRELLRGLAGLRPWSEDPELAARLRAMARRVPGEDAAGNLPEGER